MLKDSKSGPHRFNRFEPLKKIFEDNFKKEYIANDTLNEKV